MVIEPSQCLRRRRHGEKMTEKETESNESIESEEVRSDLQPDLNAEFKITVRKLELPVRPRGVLAE